MSINFREIRLPNFIIGGTNKAGTTSVFEYLSRHPEVCGASIKETRFFAKDYRNKIDEDRKFYGKYFANCRDDVKIVMEATPNYLVKGVEVAERIKLLLEEPKILFILRDPCDRMYSYFNFQLAQLALPKDLDFITFVQLCLKYDKKNSDHFSCTFDKRHLKILAFGHYVNYLKKYFTVFPKEHIKVMFFEDLAKDTLAFMKDICGFLRIRPQFYDNYEFKHVNTTSFAQSTLIHKNALRFNNRLEGFLRQKPILKKKLVSLYSFVNYKNRGYSPIPDEIRKVLFDYYSNSKKELEVFLDVKLPDRWKS